MLVCIHLYSNIDESITSSSLLYANIKIEFISIIYIYNDRTIGTIIWLPLI